MSVIFSKFTVDQEDRTQEWQARFCVGCEDGRVRIFRVQESGSCTLVSTSLRHPCKNKKAKKKTTIFSYVFFIF